MSKENPSWEELVEHNPKLEQVFPQDVFDVLEQANKTTGENLRKLWVKNAKLNAEHHWTKHNHAMHGCSGVGFNKALVVIGAGPSFNQNKRVVQELCFDNSAFPFNQQPFLFVCSNHQFKPCLADGIIPHFVILADGSEVVYDQLCRDIPSYAQNVVLLAPMRADYKVVTEWISQGRKVNFYIGREEHVVETIEKIVDRNVNETGETVIFGGNVMNMAFILGIQYMRSTVFMALGNDLSYEYHDDLEVRRSKYYADGDYSTNLGTGRDEAKKYAPWMGFKLEESILMPGQQVVRFEPRATTGQLMLYKTWMETRIGIQEKNGKPFHYYNCSEQGILGVMSRDPYLTCDVEGVLKDKSNWYMLDDIFPKRYHTRAFSSAIEEFLGALKEWRWGEKGATSTDANAAGILAVQ